MNDPPSIKTERLLLRPFFAEDIPSVQFYADPEVMRYIPGGARDKSQLTERFLGQIDVRRADWARLGFGMWAIVLNATGRVIGHCGLQYLPDRSDVEVFYLLDKPYWNQGFATEAAEATIHFGFERAGLKRIVALAMPENIGSRRVMEKAGMRFERNAHFYGCDAVLYSISRGPQTAAGERP
jgi:RimJ/RimL family protein N-acetyltransferase